MIKVPSTAIPPSIQMVEHQESAAHAMKNIWLIDRLPDDDYMLDGLPLPDFRSVCNSQTKRLESLLGHKQRNPSFLFFDMNLYVKNEQISIDDKKQLLIPNRNTRKEIPENK